MDAKLTPLGMVAERGTREAAGDTVLEGGIGSFDFGGGGANICNKPTLEFGWRGGEGICPANTDASLEGGVNFVGDGMPLGVALEDGKGGTGGFSCVAYPGARAPFARALGVFGLLVSLNMDLARLGVPFAKEPFDGDGESKGWIGTGSSVLESRAIAMLDWNDTCLLAGGTSETREVLPKLFWIKELRLDGKEDVVGDDNKDAFDDDAAGDSDG